MWKTGHTVQFSAEDKRILFEKGLKPAMKEIYDQRPRGGGIAADQSWPLDYQLSQDMLPVNTQSSFTTRQVKGEEVPQFGVRLLHHLERTSNAFHGAFFYHEIQGVKLAYEHDPEDEELRLYHLHQGLLSDFLPFRPPRIPVTLTEGGFPEVWRVDVALTFSVKDQVVHWLAASHSNCMKEAFPYTSEVNLRKEVRSSRFRIDRASHLRDVAGGLYLRGGSPNIDRRDSASQMILYCTDKNLWYKKGDSSHIYRRFYPSAVLEDTKWSEFEECTEHLADNLSRGGAVTGVERPDDIQGGSARFEVRVDAHDAQNKHYRVSDEFSMRNLVINSPKLWWCVSSVLIDSLT